MNLFEFIEMNINHNLSNNKAINIKINNIIILNTI